MPLTLLLLSALGAVFLKGFREAVGLAVPIVAIYLVLNVVVVLAGSGFSVSNPERLSGWGRIDLDASRESAA